MPWTIVPYLPVLAFYVASFFIGDRAALDRHASRALVNLTPSLHIGVLLILWVRLRPFIPARWRDPMHGWFALIGVSVLTTYQHHLIDTPAGLAVGAIGLALISRAGVVRWIGGRGGTASTRAAAQEPRTMDTITRRRATAP